MLGKKRGALLRSARRGKGEMHEMGEAFAVKRERSEMEFISP